MANCIWKKYNCDSKYIDNGWINKVYVINVRTDSNNIAYQNQPTFLFDSLKGKYITSAGEVPLNQLVLGNSTSGPFYTINDNAGVMQSLFYGFVRNEGDGNFLESKQARLSSHTYIKGPYLTTVTAAQNTYPQNGRHTDGYWYEYVGLACNLSVNVNGISKQADTSYSNVNGVWRENNEVKANINGIWK